MGNNLLISVSGIRGIIGARDGLTPEFVSRFSGAFGSWCRGGRIIVGGDCRISREMVQQAVTSGLMAVGSDVVDIGICPTPTVELAVRKLRARGGIAITASHNPIQWNALKLINSRGMFLSAEEGDEVRGIFESGQINYRPYNRLGSLCLDMTLLDYHLERILDLEVVNLRLIRKRKYKVVIDTVNGAGSVISPVLLEELGCRVVELNTEPTGFFAHSPEPLPKNLSQLRKMVKAKGADIGFANDPDADRLAIVTDRGLAPGEEYTLALATRFILAKKKGPVVVNLSTSRMIDDVAREFKRKVYRTKVGEINVALKMKEVRAPIGGEGNGGVIYPRLHYGRDALLGMALILSYMAECGESISELIRGLPKYYMIKDRISATPKEIRPGLRRLEKHFRGAKFDETDGLKIDLPEGWLHIRVSNTEPIVRLLAEGRSTDFTRQMIQRVKKELCC
ncbi:MAG: phosphoglucosamine mutase [Candidatus Zixiibacteriota bacterium]